MDNTGAERLESFERDRRHLLAVAFRLLGSEADAQDVLQEAWIRFARTNVGELSNVSAWLTTVVTRLCLDVLRRRRVYLQQPADIARVAGVSGNTPEEVALLAAELTEAFSVLLQKLTPPQRVALILHEVFGTPFDEVARILGTTPVSAKSWPAARERLSTSTDASRADPASAHRVVSEFLRAAQSGDIQALVGVLHPAVPRTADPQVLPAGAPLKIRGADALLTEIRTFQATARKHVRRPSTDDQELWLAQLKTRLPCCSSESSRNASFTTTSSRTRNVWPS